MSCTLYRFFDATDALLYVGISENGPQRWKQHRKSKSWWSDVARATTQHFDAREEAASAERSAIIAELPKWNIVYNRCRPGQVQLEPEVQPVSDGPWHFKSRRTGFARTCALYLSVELSSDPCVDDVWDLSGEQQFDYWVSQIQKHQPSACDANEVPIHWFIGGGGTFEAAPWPRRAPGENDFMSSFTWPINVDTGERCDFWALPINERFPAFAEIRGPLQPFQATYPIRTRLDLRDGFVSQPMSGAPT